MAIVVETGAGVENANAYATVDFVDRYLDCRGRLTENDWDMLSDVAKGGHIVSATDYIDRRFTFKGTKASLQSFYQVLQFPRTGISDRDGVAIAVMPLPYELMAATAEYAVRAVAGKLWEDHESVANRGVDSQTTQTSTITEGTIKSRRVGPLEVEFFAPGTTTRVSNYHSDSSRTSSDIFMQDPYPEADNLLRDLIRQETRTAQGFGTGDTIR